MPGNNKQKKTLQEIITEYKESNAQKLNFSDKVGYYRETMTEMALLMLKEDRVIRNFIRWPRWSHEDLAGSDFQIFYVNGENKTKSLSISVLGPKYAHLEKEAHPDVDIVLPVSMVDDSVGLIADKIKKLKEEKEAPS
jgi:hypothetical protein